MKVTDKITITNEDNMLLMARYPDNYFDLAIVDPPYGIKASSGASTNGSMRKKIASGKIKGGNWDDSIPNKEYFDELFRVSKNQVIWGGNYFIEYLKNTRCCLIWDKSNGTNSMADAEIAWTSFDKCVRLFKSHIFSEIGCTKYKTTHPTQKPVKIYRWVLNTVATKGMNILDTHGGSMTIAIACDMEGFDLDICEIDKDYFDKGVETFNIHKMQFKLGDSPKERGEKNLIQLGLSFPISDETGI